MTTTELQPNPIEQQPESKRPEYAPVPLDPWNTMHPIIDQEPYILASTDRINSQLDAAFEESLNWWVGSAEHAAALYIFMQKALFDAQMMRIHRNAVRMPAGKECVDDDVIEPIDHDNIPVDVVTLLDGSDPIVQKALHGRASPEELLILLETNPILESTELAKQSHPLDFTGTRKMNQVIDELIGKRDGVKLESQPKYEVVDLDPKNLMMTAERKHTIATMFTDSGPVEVIKRELLLIRGDAEATDGNHLMPRRMRNPDRRHELWDKAEIYFSYLSEEQNLRRVDLNPQVKWIQPLTTSVYIRHEKSTE